MNAAARFASAIILAPIALAPLGCAGRAVVHAVPVGIQRINVEGPLIPTFKPDECYHWIDDDGNLRVAMRSRKRSLLDRRLDRDFVLSFVFDGVPAGDSRDYRFNRRTARCRASAAIFHSRSASLSGIASVWNYGRPTLRGRFRFHAKIQVYHLLAGWRDDGQVIYTGEFSSVANRTKGEAILELSEGTGMERSAVGEPPRRPAPSPRKAD